MKDQDRLAQAASRFAEELEFYGLRRIKYTIRETDVDGWWAAVANWTPTTKRPKISIWLDRSLLGRQRRFWFGFQSSDRQCIRDLLKQFRELRTGLPEPIKITKNDWTEVNADTYGLQRKVAAKVKQSKLVYETYSDEFDGCDYLGICEYAFNFGSLSDLSSQAARLIGDVVRYVDPQLAENEDVRKIDDPDPSVREQLILARKGQGKFRTDLMTFWGGCAVTKCTLSQVLRASHIKPWRKCTGKSERLDGRNGLLLTATLDALFDRGLISFNDNGTIKISSRLNQKDRQRLNLEDSLKLSRSLSRKQRAYLRAHREHEFERV